MYEEHALEMTGGFLEKHKSIDYPIGRFRVKVELDQGNHFVGISEIAERTDFLSVEQKVKSADFFDVDDYYRD